MPKTRSKFGVNLSSKGKAERTCLDYITGEPITFDSKIEMKYYQDIVIPRLESGEIVKAELQKKYNLQPAFKYGNKTIRAIDYVSDFTLTYKDGSILVVDIKGQATADAKIKKKMMHYIYPEINFVWLSYTKATGWIEYEELQKVRRGRKKEKKKNE